MTTLDARQYGFHLEFIFGPIRVPSRSDMVDALLTIIRESPLLRVGADVTSDRRSRVQDPNRLREWAESLIVSVPGDGLDYFVNGFAERSAVTPDGSAMRITLTDYHVIFRGDHSLGDSGILMRMAPAVIAVATGRPVPGWLLRAEAKRVLLRALWHTFAHHPRQLFEAFVTRPPAWQSGDVSEFRPWRPDPVLSVAHLSNQRFGELRRAYKRQSSRVPATISMILLVRSALEAESVDVSPQSWIPVDARRYLPPGVDTIGNFGADVLVSSAGGASAIEMSEQLTRSLTSGRPLLPMTWDSLRRVPNYRLVTDVPVRPRADVSVVTLGLRQEVEGLPWVDPSDRRFYATGPDPDPLAIRCGVMATRTGATLTASFHANVFARERVEAALTRLSSGDISELLGQSAVNAA